MWVPIKMIVLPEDKFCDSYKGFQYFDTILLKTGG